MCTLEEQFKSSCYIDDGTKNQQNISTDYQDVSTDMTWIENQIISICKASGNDVGQCFVDTTSTPHGKIFSCPNDTLEIIHVNGMKDRGINYIIVRIDSKSNTNVEMIGIDFRNIENMDNMMSSIHYRIENGFTVPFNINSIYHAKQMPIVVLHNAFDITASTLMIQYIFNIKKRKASKTTKPMLTLDNTHLANKDVSMRPTNHSPMDTFLNKCIDFIHDDVVIPNVSNTNEVTQDIISSIKMKQLCMNDLVGWVMNVLMKHYETTFNKYICAHYCLLAAMDSKCCFFSSIIFKKTPEIKSINAAEMKPLHSIPMVVLDDVFQTIIPMIEFDKSLGQQSTFAQTFVKTFFDIFAHKMVDSLLTSLGFSQSKKNRSLSYLTTMLRGEFEHSGWIFKYCDI